MSALVYSTGIDWEQGDFAILSARPVGLYRSVAGLDGAVQALLGLGYGVATVDAPRWEVESDLFDAFADRQRAAQLRNIQDSTGGRRPTLGELSLSERACIDMAPEQQS